MPLRIGPAQRFELYVKTDFNTRQKKGKKSWSKKKKAGLLIWKKNCLVKGESFW